MKSRLTLRVKSVTISPIIKLPKEVLSSDILGVIRQLLIQEVKDVRLADQFINSVYMSGNLKRVLDRFSNLRLTKLSEYISALWSLIPHRLTVYKDILKEYLIVAGIRVEVKVQENSSSVSVVDEYRKYKVVFKLLELLEMIVGKEIKLNLVDEYPQESLEVYEGELREQGRIVYVRYIKSSKGRSIQVLSDLAFRVNGKFTKARETLPLISFSYLFKEYERLKNVEGLRAFLKTLQSNLSRAYYDYYRRNMFDDMINVIDKAKLDLETFVVRRLSPESLSEENQLLVYVYRYCINSLKELEERIEECKRTMKRTHRADVAIERLLKDISLLTYLLGYESD